MLPRTFVRMDTEDVYVPRRLTQSSNGDLWCSCVYTCDQFMTYPVDVHGRRIIPLDATCPNLATASMKCTGEYIWCNGAVRFDKMPHRDTLQIWKNCNKKQR